MFVLILIVFKIDAIGMISHFLNLFHMIPASR